MKKTYIIPNIQVVIMTSRQAIMAGSEKTASGLTGHGGWGGISNDNDECD